MRSQGKGTFVAPQKKLQSANDTTGLTDSCRQAGKVLKSQVLSVEYAYPTHADSEFLAVDESQQVIEIKRLRYICLLYTSSLYIHLSAWLYITISAYTFQEVFSNFHKVFSGLRRFMYRHLLIFII